MKRLILYRHAKSDWGDASLADKDRPLNDRGRRSAQVMAEYLHQEGLFPDLILCSSSQRTRETLAPLLPHLPTETEIRLLDVLYDVHGEDYLKTVRLLGGTAGILMLIGHNPAMEATAFSLIKDRTGSAWQDLSGKFPTAAIAIFDFELETWADLAVETGCLVSFVKPRDLMPANA